MKKTPLELAKEIQIANPEKLGKMNEKKIALIIREAFFQVKKELKNTEDDVVRIAGFGNFKVRTIVQDNGGKKVTVKRIIFREAKEK